MFVDPVQSAASKPLHFAFIDALRGFALLAVLFFHVSQRVAGLPPLLADGLGRGFACTLCMSLAGRADEPAAIRSYAIRRVCRIAPMFWCAIGLYLIVNGFGPHWGVPDGLRGWQVLLAALLLHGIDPHALNGVVPGGWSVATEVQFYLILPLLLACARTLRRAIGLWLGCIGLSIAALPALEALLTPFYPGQSELVHQFAFFSLPVQLPAFGGGLVLYRLLGPDRNTLARIERCLPARPQRRATLIVALVLALAFPVDLAASPVTLLHGIPGHLGYGLLFVLLAYGLATFPLGLIVNSVSRWLGRVSYSAYLLQFAVLDGLAPVLRPVLAGQPLAQLAALGSATLAVTVLLATATHALIEQPGIALGRRLIARLAVARTAAARGPVAA